MGQESASEKISVAPRAHRTISAIPLEATEFERYRRKLCYKVYYHLGASCPDADDVVQESMLRFVLALKVERIHNPDRRAAFLSGICNNVIYEYKRRTLREPLAFEGSAETGAYSECDLVELRQTIKLVVTHLATRDQELLRLFYLEEKDKGEICREMGLSDLGFRVALCRVKKRFREIHSQTVKQNQLNQH